MLGTDLEINQDGGRSNWVRLRTLVVLRWFAVLGQSLAILVASRVYGLQIDLSATSVVILSSILVNVLSVVLYPQTQRLSDTAAILTLIFDVVQLGALLYLTGGLSNPFALLLLAPVTISATVLPLRAMMGVAFLAMVVISALSLFSHPLITADGTILALPEMLQFGIWASLIIGLAFNAFYAHQVTGEINDMSEALLATQLALGREQKLTDLGGVVAAAAHELGTPLATIKLVSAELSEELSGHDELQEDARLIHAQAERCRMILQSMGRAGKEDLLLRHAPFQAVVSEAAEPHLDRGKQVVLDAAAENETDTIAPMIERNPAIVHGLRNLVQNAVDFAESRVEITVDWTDDTLSVRIEDDGAGFPPSVIGRIGEPFMRRRSVSLDVGRRPEYEGMGLGLFIAKTLLERTGAKLRFSNRGSRLHRKTDETGAVVTVRWNRSKLEIHNSELGPNKRILS